MSRFAGATGSTRMTPLHLQRDPVQGALELDTVREGAFVTYKLTFPWLPPSKNVIDGWDPRWKDGAKKKWMRKVAALCAQQNIPLDNPEIGLAAKLYFASNRRRDRQNYSQTLWHWVPDGLLGCTKRCQQPCPFHAGVLRDDNQGRVQFGPNLGIELVYDPRQAPKNKIERTVVAITVRRAVPRGQEQAAEGGGNG